jgi:nucleotide-binding universal stress UspA family protein
MQEISNQYNKLLLLTDLTDKSLSALSYARAFAEFYESHLMVLHVLPPPRARRESDHPAGYDSSGTAASIRKRLESLARSLRADGISAQIRLCHGAVTADTILSNIRVMRPDLIIQGCDGMNSFRRPFVGSIAEEILRSTDKPVLTVPAGLKAISSRFLRFNRILLATDFGSAARTVSSHALLLAQEFGSRVYLCHVHNDDSKRRWSDSERSTFFRNELNRLVDPSATDFCDPKSVVAFGKAPETILKLADTENCDLIVLGAHALGPLGSRGRPGTVLRVISGANCPVLTISSVKRDETAIKAEQIEVIRA